MYPRQRPDIETHILPDGSCLIFDAVANQGRALNAAGALTWDYCDGTHTPDEIAAEVAALLPDFEPARQATLRLLDDLGQAGFLVAAQPGMAANEATERRAL
jgi:hypothetical protein